MQRFILLMVPVVITRIRIQLAAPALMVVLGEACQDQGGEYFDQYFPHDVEFSRPTAKINGDYSLTWRTRILEEKLYLRCQENDGFKDHNYSIVVHCCSIS